VLAARRARYARVSDSLASLGDAELAALLGGGRSVIVDFNGVQVFAKRVPLTDRELAHPRSTANLFGLPTFCQYGFGLPKFPEYGFGGPGLNGWRELVANLVVTDGVLVGETESFPLLYHWRVLPGSPPLAAGAADVDAAVAALDGSPAVRTRLEALLVASHSLVLFCEYIPNPASDWLQEAAASKAELVERQLLGIVAFLRGRELLHLDGHFGNMRTDGERIYLTDFGLATSPRFDLSAAEHDFAERNATHDADCAAMRLVHWLATASCGVPRAARYEFVRRCADGDIPDGLPPAVAGILTRHSPAAARASSFYRRLYGGDLHAKYL
jgi:hypothetical protein